jgi:hypothetical protein
MDWKSGYWYTVEFAKGEECIFKVLDTSGGGIRVE